MSICTIHVSRKRGHEVLIEMHFIHVLLFALESLFTVRVNRSVPAEV